MKKLLIMASLFWPQKNSGGPPISIMNLVQAVKGKFDISIISKNHEINDDAPLEEIAPGWNQFDFGRAYYTAKGDHSFGHIKSRLDKAAAKKKFDRWLKENFYYKDREKNYRDIKPRIMCDAFLRPADGQLEEYKLFCFRGKVGFIQHNKQIAGRRYDNIFDAEWNILPVKYGYDGFPGDSKPQNGDELVAIAEKLAEPFELVRVDLYNVDGRIVFSELTFHSGGGLIPFEPKEYDREFGKMMGL